MSGRVLELLLVAGLASGVASTALVAVGWTRRRSRYRVLAWATHELRGALTALNLGFSTLERSSQPRRSAADDLGGLRAQVRRAMLAVDDVDTCRRGRAGVLEIRGPGPLDLAAIVLRSTHAWSRLAPRYDATLEVDWRAGDVRVEGDGTRLAQAFDNLIANALEHGGGRVRVVGELVDGTARITISDGGAGLPRPPAELRRAPWKAVRGHGLAIVREIVEAHGGRLERTSGADRGAVVVELPAGPATDPLPRRTRGAGSGRLPASARSSAQHAV